MLRGMLWCGALGASLGSAGAFTSDSCGLSRTFDRTSTLTNLPVVVSALFTNGAAASVRGLSLSEQLPPGLAVQTLAVIVNGRAVTNYHFESGLAGDVYAGLVPYRWTLEMPASFAQSNPVPAAGTALIQYSLVS